MDEAEIIRRRDGVAAGASDEPLDSNARRALADARLRALAFSLIAEQGAGPEAREVDDTELLAYLLDILPEDRRIALEEVVRGDARAFGRLMTLRTAFNSQTDPRDRRRADDPSRNIPRHTVGRVDIRRVGDLLQFTAREPRQRPPASQQFAVHSPGAEFHAYRVAPQMAKLREIRPARLRLGPKSEASLRNLLDRVRRHFDAGRNLLQEIDRLLASWQENRQRSRFQWRQTERMTHGDARSVEDRLAELLRELQLIGVRIREEIDEIDLATDAKFAPEEFVAPQSAVPFVADEMPLEANLRLPTARETWADAFDIEAGDWALHLVGLAIPTPRLAITLRSKDGVTTPIEPFLTLVRPADGFEIVNLDSSGHGEVALPSGDIVLLVQGDEVWNLHLSFRN
jgi:hypothetical protein